MFGKKGQIIRELNKTIKDIKYERGQLEQTVLLLCKLLKIDRNVAMQMAYRPRYKNLVEYLENKGYIL